MLKLIYDFTISGLNSSLIFRRLTSKILLELIQKLSNIYDPLIQYKIDDRTLHLPMSHALPIVMNAHPYYSRNLARIASCIQAKYPDLTIIDIGANIGDSVFMLRNSVSCPILCIEGDPRFFEILRMNTTSFENVSIEQAFVGNDEGEINKQLVVVSGTAHFENSTNKTTKFRKLTSILANNPKFLKAKILKIDTDGFDLSIVRGAIDFIQTAKPIIFFEYDPYFLSKQNDDGISIFSLLSSLNYHSIVVYDSLGRYLISLSLTEFKQIEDLHQYLLHRNGSFYYDICAFHQEDMDSIDRIRNIEAVFLAESNILSTK